MELSEEVLAVIARVTPEELAQTRRWCGLGDRVHLLSDLTEGRVNATPLTGKRKVGVRESRAAHKGAAKLGKGRASP